jgi:hypothetical protein
MAKLLGLRIKPATIPHAGKGLFSAKPFHVGDVVTTYTGDSVTGEEPDTKGSMYVAQVDRTHHIDAARRNAGYGRMVNSPAGTGRRTNLRWVIDKRRKIVKLVASQEIPPGEELLIGYGGGYWGRVHRAANDRRKLELAVVKARAAKKP